MFINNIVLVVALLVSYLQLGATEYEYIYPNNDSENVVPSTILIIRHGDLLDINSIHNAINLFDSSNNPVSGVAVLAIDGKTLNFKPTSYLLESEKYTLSINGLRSIDGIVLPELNLKFITSKKAQFKKYDFEIDFPNIVRNDLDDNILKELETNHQHAMPDNMPKFGSINNNSPSKGFYFVAPFFSRYRINPSIVILDNYGTPIFYRRMQVPEDSTKFTFWMDFKKVSDTSYVYASFLGNYYLLLDKNLRVVDTLRMLNGIRTDFHDMQFLRNGNRAMLSYMEQYVDLSKYYEGGDPNGILTIAYIQEIDPENNLIMQWNSLDEISPINAAEEHIDLFAEGSIDYFHINSIHEDTDTSFIWSARNVNAVGKISRKSDKLVWTMGSSRLNDMTFNSDIPGEEPTFVAQHDFRKISNGNFTLFDNVYRDDEGNLTSRGCVYEINEDNKIANLIQVFRNKPNSYSGIMSNMQRLDNGNFIVTWAVGSPKITEFSPSGKVVNEITFDAYSYRAFKYDFKHNLFTLDINSIDMGTVYLDTFATHKIDIMNNSAETIEIDEFLVHNPELIRCVTKLPILIEPKQSKSIEILFEPEEVGVYSDVATICMDNVLERYSQQVIIKAEADIFVNTPVSSINDLVNIYPNPANERVTINSKNIQGNELIISFIDLQGNVVLEEVFEISDSNISLMLDLYSVPTGIYNVVINNGNTKYFRRLSVIK